MDSLTMTTSNTTSLASDQVFEILSSQRRRMVLYYLRKHDGTATMNELAEQIAAWENDVDIEELTSQQRKRVYVSLYQTHLSKLAETNLVDYDVDEGNVRLTDQASEIDAFLAPKHRSNYPWKRHYVGFMLVGGLAVVLAILATPVLGMGLLLWLAGGLIVGYLATVAVEYWHYREEQAEIPGELVPRDR
jgi:DNA-binding transcriptional ArsR family regulator